MYTLITGSLATSLGSHTVTTLPLGIHPDGALLNGEKPQAVHDPDEHGYGRDWRRKLTTTLFDQGNTAALEAYARSRFPEASSILLDHHHKLVFVEVPSHGAHRVILI